jgi:uncharacterized membrane protein
MKRFVTAPCVGFLVGALEGGVVFTILTLIDVERGKSAGVDNELIYLGTGLGIVLGGLAGAVIGLVVALRNAGARDGLVIGSIAGVALAIYLFRGTGPYDDLMRTLALIAIPGAASMGLLSAVLTTRRKQPHASTESRHSHHIIS